jgi:hypothetical protein
MGRNFPTLRKSDRGSASPGPDLPLFELAARLPGPLEWGVLFRTGALARLIAAEQLDRMFGFPAAANASASLCVALTSAGKCLVFDADGPWVWPFGAPPLDAGALDRFVDRLSLLAPPANADCLAFGQLAGLPPVVMALVIADGVATAEALFDERPPEDNYDLLAAVGVRPRGGEPRGRHWLARFDNGLADHLETGALAGFGRTANCNRFFLNHGRIDETVAAGLLQAAADRVANGLSIATATAVGLVLAARKNELAMTCVPPAPQPSYPFGDLVPLGMLAYALRRMAKRDPAAEAAAILTRRYLERHRAGDLWPFHRGRLPTATDSALILLGRDDEGAIEALEPFADGAGGYLPQLSSAEGDGSHMREDAALRHWCQPDLGTTCLARALRRAAGLEERTPLAWLETRFERRAALFFANPYLVDWAFALAIAGDAPAIGLRDRLAAEIVASANGDGSFGGFDRPLSTALAILALAALGWHGRMIRIAQLRLLEALEPQGRGPPTTPFYSTQRLPLAAAAAAIRGRGLLAVDGEWHALSLYEDTHRMVLGALALLALQVPCDAREGPPAPTAAAHPRYLAISAARYVEAFALPPYLGSRS